MLTGRTRTLTATASGSNSTSATWPGGSAGGGGTYSFTFTQRIHPDDPLLRQVRINVSVTAALGGAHLGSGVSASNTSSSDWYTLPSGTFANPSHVTITGSTSWAATETATLVETTDLGEYTRDIAFSGSCSTSVGITWRPYSGGPVQPVQSSSATAIGTYSSTPGVLVSGITDYTKSYSFGSFSPTFFSNGTFIFLTADFPGTVSVDVTCAGLEYNSDEFSIASNGMSMTGTSSGASMAGTPTSPFSLFNLADCTARPRVAVQITSNDTNYEDGSPIAVEVQRRSSGGVIESTFVGSDSIPAGEYILARVSNAGATQGKYEVDTEPLWQARTFLTRQAWADSYGITPMARDAYNEAIAGTADHLIRATKRVKWGEWTFAPTHSFGLFSNASYWAAVSSAASGQICADNPQYNTTPGNVSISAGPGGLTATAAGAIGVLCTKTDGNPNATFLHSLKYYGYRYARLAVKASVPGARFRFCFSDATSVPLYAWEFTAGTDWETKELDLALPPLRNAQWAGSATHEVVWQANTGTVWHPKNYYPVGAGIWIELLDAATYEFGSFTGYYRPEPGNTEDRIPVLLQLPVNNWADSNGDSDLTHFEGEYAGPGVSGYYVARVMVNGAVGINFMLLPSGDVPTINEYWTTQKQWLDDDTGITLTLDTSNSDWLDFLPVHTSTYEGGVNWQEVTPGTPVACYARGRMFELDGYPGMGDLEGAYSSTLQFVLDKILNGELCGLTYRNDRSIAGVPVYLHDNDTGNLLTSGTSNRDGFYRLFHKYGVKYPVNSTFNYPGSAGPSTKEYSGGSDPVYTPLGKQLNSYWVKGSRLTELKDADGYLTQLDLRRHFIILSHYANVVDLRARPAGMGGVDLLQNTAGWWFRAYRDTESLQVARSLDAGASWPLAVTLPVTAPDAAPTLVSDGWDTLWCWGHDAEEHTRGFVSKDGGASWSAWATHAGLRYPRAVRPPNRLFFAAYRGSGLVFYDSADDGLTLSEISALALSAPEQLPALRVDRRGVVHLVYTDGNQLLHRWLQGNDTWSAATVLTAGTLPAYGVGIERGFLLRFDGESLGGRKTDEAYGADAGAITAPAGADWSPDYLGAQIGEHLGTAEVWLMCGWDETAETLEVRYSDDQGATWHEPS
jgi:hypothetical protein